MLPMESMPIEIAMLQLPPIRHTCLPVILFRSLLLEGHCFWLFLILFVLCCQCNIGRYKMQHIKK